MAVYPRFSLLNHSCAPNAEHSVDPATLDVTVTAAADIAKGEEVTVSYLSSQVGNEIAY